MGVPTALLNEVVEGILLARVSPQNRADEALEGQTDQRRLGEEQEAILRVTLLGPQVVLAEQHELAHEVLELGVERRVRKHHRMVFTRRVHQDIARMSACASCRPLAPALGSCPDPTMVTKRLSRSSLRVERIGDAGGIVAPVVPSSIVKLFPKQAPIKGVPAEPLQEAADGNLFLWLPEKTKDKEIAARLAVRRGQQVVVSDRAFSPRSVPSFEEGRALIVGGPAVWELDLTNGKTKALSTPRKHRHLMAGHYLTGDRVLLIEDLEVFVCSRAGDKLALDFSTTFDGDLVVVAGTLVVGGSTAIWVLGVDSDVLRVIAEIPEQYVQYPHVRGMLVEFDGEGGRFVLKGLGGALEAFQRGASKLPRWAGAE